ncbi:M20 family metallopeptidase [Kiritimatiella glycovorans]|uniref:Acetylornithine deacetylase n=1 Tax=Kiritimatiella glycovorans TaxID=1307763 RepID=A0A0G3EHK3_9BACT|nr:M20/M25/M40 family metallo-hydrolase [Kiritimatiella glycovorans]AKJ64897.1 Acetylornithine deacetylase [Kiritimatiella glycovorans]
MSGSAIRRDRLFALFGDMVDLYSPSGKEDELTSFLEDYLRACGLAVESQPVDETRRNLIVSAGASPSLLFLGHIDTVPACDIEHYGFSACGSLCRGLGTADMKGGCAAMIEAFAAAAEQGTLGADAALALVVGEEETGDGTRALLESHRFREALVGEPTALRPCLAHYGYVEMFVRAFGARRHAAMSTRDTNAIRALLRLLLRIEERVERDEPDTVLNIRDLRSSEAGFAVPDLCAAGVDLHVPPDTRAGPYAKELRRFVDATLEESRASRYEIEFPTLADGFRVDPASELPRTLRRVLEGSGRAWSPAAFASHSDANLLYDAGCRPVVLGPGRLADAHTRDECIDFEQVVAASEIYAGVLSELYGENF